MEVGGWRLEAGGWRLEAGDWRLEDENLDFLRSAAFRTAEMATRGHKNARRDRQTGSKITHFVFLCFLVFFAARAE